MDFMLEDAQNATLGARSHFVSACFSALRGSFAAGLACLRRPHCATNPTTPAGCTAARLSAISHRDACLRHHE